MRHREVDRRADAVVFGAELGFHAQTGERVVDALRRRPGDAPGFHQRLKLLEGWAQIEGESFQTRDVVLLDQIEAVPGDQRLLVLRVVKIDVGDAKLQLQIRPHVRQRLRLDDSLPANRADALTAHQRADHQAAIAFELDSIASAGEARIFDVEVLALIGPVPDRHAAVIGIKLLAQRGGERHVVDRDRDANHLRCHDRIDGSGRGLCGRLGGRSRLCRMRRSLQVSGAGGESFWRRVRARPTTNE